MKVNALSSDIRKGEKLFTAEYGYESGRHKVNLSRKAVPNELIEAVIDGCDIETVEELAKGFPICKYKTQITIHGKFPELTTDRVAGGYVNLVRNKNKSLGIRYSAIDCRKRAKLNEWLRPCGWYYYFNSSEQFFALSERFSATETEAINAKIAEYKKIMDGIDRSLFFGGMNIVSRPLWGSVTISLVVVVSAVYEKNLRKLAVSMSGLTEEELTAKAEAEEARRRQYEKEREEAEHRRKLVEIAKEGAKELFMLEHPCKAKWTIKLATLNAGDRFVRCVYTGDGKENHTYEWRYYSVGTCFGKRVAYPCDENFNRIEGRSGIELPRFARKYKVVTAVKAA